MTAELAKVANGLLADLGRAVADYELSHQRMIAEWIEEESHAPKPEAKPAKKRRTAKQAIEQPTDPGVGCQCDVTLLEEWAATSPRVFAGTWGRVAASASSNPFMIESLAAVRSAFEHLFTTVDGFLAEGRTDMPLAARAAIGEMVAGAAKATEGLAFLSVNTTGPPPLLPGTLRFRIASAIGSLEKASPAAIAGCLENDGGELFNRKSIDEALRKLATEGHVIKLARAVYTLPETHQKSAIDSKAKARKPRQNR